MTKSKISKPITVNGVLYDSLNQASKATGFERKTLRIQREIQGDAIVYSIERKPPNFWTFERVQEIALTCKTRTEFWEKHKGAALRAQRQGWLNKLYDHIEFKKKDKGYWQILANVKKVSQLCKTRSEFQKKYPAAYSSAVTNGWYDQISRHMISQKSLGEVLVRKFLLSHDIKSISQMKFSECRDKRPLPFDEYLPDFKILIEIQGAQHKTGWGQKSESLNYISKHDKIKKEFAINNGYKLIEIWDFEEELIESILLKEINAVIGKRQLNIFLQKRQLTRRENEELKTLGQWTFQKVQNLSKKCKTLQEFSEKYPVAYQKAHKAGWAKDIFSHLERKLRNKGYWNKDKVLEAALSCNTKIEFQKKYVAAYNTALKNGYLEDACSHMVSLRVSTWTLESIKDVANKCKTYNEFKTRYPTAYASARKNNWLNEVRLHMKPGQLPHGYWNNLNHIIEVAKKCKTKTEFQKKYGSARAAAKKNGWYEIVCSHFSN